MLIAIALFALILPKQDTPQFLWNASPSVPIGLYSLSSRQPSKRRLAVIRLPEPFLGLAHVRGYLPAGTLLIKPVAATAGDLVCRHGATVTINGRTAALAKTADARGRLLPRWRGCMRLTASQVFLLAAGADSFDSRYVGPLDRRYVLGTALPTRLLTRA